MAIPKVIHNCWFGSGRKSKEILSCIESWKTSMHDFEIKEWNESNFDVYCHPWMKKTIDEKNYAFSSDYFRYKTLCEYGGIYLDTDVKIIKSLTPFLNDSFFIGFMSDAALATAVIGVEPKHPVIKKILELFDNGRASDIYPSNEWITQFFLDEFDDFLLTGKNQVLKNDVHVYKKEYFDRPTNKKNMGYAIHYYNGSWYKRKNKLHRKIIKKILGEIISAKIAHKISLNKAKHNKVYLEHKKREKQKNACKQ